MKEYIPKMNAARTQRQIYWHIRLGEPNMHYVAFCLAIVYARTVSRRVYQHRFAYLAYSEFLCMCAALFMPLLHISERERETIQRRNALVAVHEWAPSRSNGK